MSREYRLFFKSRYQKECFRRVWPKNEPPEGMLYCYLAGVTRHYDYYSAKVVAICEKDGRRFRRTHSIKLEPKGVKRVRLRLVEVPDGE